MSKKLTRKQYGQYDSGGNGGMLREGGISFTDLAGVREQREIKAKRIEMPTKIWIPPFEPYEKELVDYNRITNNGIANMREINDVLLNMKQRGDVLTLSTAFTTRVSNTLSYYFLSNPLQQSDRLYDIRLFQGFYAYLVDSSNKTKIIQINGYGTGETLDINIFVNGDFSSAEPPGVAWARNGWTIIGGIATSPLSADCWLWQAVGLTNRLYKLVVTVNSLNQNFNIGCPGSFAIYNAVYTPGLKRCYVTKTPQQTGAGFHANLIGTIAVLDDASFQQVLTPDDKGIWFIPVSENSGWNPNDTYKCYIRYKI